uniref:Transient receptor potential cation channel subfamily M member 2-like isoform X1 n=1 Tax=Crassostrea virginica TaxID=6565 RepID=A0A8B8C7M3_CRAVI|nr:transient receptor potential cation channel subfamily M member 2-like isoform X1 [Crassostrea virginica]
MSANQGLEAEKNEEVNDVKSAWENILQNTLTVPPTMVFSVIGDSHSFVPRPWPRTVFQTALIEAAKSGGESWILYSGSNQAVSKTVRGAYNNYKTREFGMQCDEESETRNDEIEKKKHIKLISISDEKREENNKGIEVCYRKGLHDFRIQFEKFVSEQEVYFFQKENFRMPVPIAILVCEGDIETVAHTAAALRNKLPVVIMKGSGKAADLILDYMERFRQFRKKAALLFGIKFDETIFQKLKENLRIIRKNKDLVGVFDLNSDDPMMLSGIVGEAVVCCWSVEKILTGIEGDTAKRTEESSEEKPPISEFNQNACHSITKNEIIDRNSHGSGRNTMHDFLDGHISDVLNTDFTSPTSLPLYFYFGYQFLQEENRWQESGHILLLEALKGNRCDYVRVLLDQGINLQSRDLPELYVKTLPCQECKYEDSEDPKKSNKEQESKMEKTKDKCFHMQWILKQILEKEAEILCDPYKSERNEKNTEENETQKNDENTKIDIGREVATSATKLCCEILRYKGITEKEEKNKDSGVKEIGISDILLWAIFADRKEIAEMCWIRCENQILSGLVCSALLKKLSNKAQNVKEHSLSTEFAEHARLFEQRCINIMDRMYKEEPIHAVNAMNDNADIWGIKSSPLNIAYDNFMYDVVAHICSRKYMNKQWYNELAPDVKPFLKSAPLKPRKFFSAPFTKYLFNYMMFFSMLIMYSAFVLTSVHTDYYKQGKGKIFEFYVYVWAFGDFIEELISCFDILGSKGLSHRGLYRRLKRHLYDFWNAVDLLSYALLIAALFVRHFHQSENFTVARRMFSLSLLVMYLRFLEVFLIHRTLGPTLIMIKEMLKDLLNFLFIAMFVIFGVGIYYEANLFPDNQRFWTGDWTEWRIWDVLYYPYWQIYAELNLEYLNADETPKVNDPTPRRDWTVLVIAATYILFAHLLLVNLVIAMFSYTFERVKQNSEKLWWYERFTAINDYQWRIASPFNLIFIPERIYTGCRKIKCCPRNNNSVRPEEIDNKKAHRKELQRIIACSIYNKI